MNMICAPQLPGSMDSSLPSASALITFLDVLDYLCDILVEMFLQKNSQNPQLRTITKCIVLKCKTTVVKESEQVC